MEATLERAAIENIFALCPASKHSQLRDTLQELFPDQNIEIPDKHPINLAFEEAVERAVFRVSGIRMDEMTAQCRKKPYVRARRVWFWLMRRFTFRSLMSLGEMLNRDHATVIHSVNGVENLICVDSDEREFVRHVCGEMREMGFEMPMELFDRIIARHEQQMAARQKFR